MGNDPYSGSGGKPLMHILSRLTAAFWQQPAIEERDDPFDRSRKSVR